MQQESLSKNYSLSWSIYLLSSCLSALYTGYYRIEIHVTLDMYRVKKPEEALYTEVNFITQEDPS